MTYSAPTDPRNVIYGLFTVPGNHKRCENYLRTAVNTRWWGQLVGHFPFVGLAIVSMVARGQRER